MDKLYGDLKAFVSSKKVTIDSVVFRLHYRVTLIILVVFSITVTGKQYIGDPIDCISKDDIPPNLLDTYCWIHTTFSVEAAWFKKVGDQVPYPGVHKFVPGEKRVYHAYYQWVCFVLFLQAILFYIPRYLWKHMESHRIQNLVMDLNCPIVLEDKEQKIDLLVDYLKENTKNHKYFAGFYTFSIILNLINVVGQIFLTDVFLGGEFTSYGLEVIKFTEWEWNLRYDPMIKVFPRMTKCTFHRFGSSGDVQKHDAMCLLPINIINEKIYVFLWFWFVILSIATLLEVIFRFIAYCSIDWRLAVLRWRSGNLEKKHLNNVVKNICDQDDWLVLCFLCKNMENEHYKTVMTRLSNLFPEEDSESFIEVEPAEKSNDQKKK